jgi:hypothetical protein
MDVELQLFKNQKPSCARVLCSCGAQNIEVIYKNSYSCSRYLAISFMNFTFLILLVT